MTASSEMITFINTHSTQKHNTKEESDGLGKARGEGFTEREGGLHERREIRRKRLKVWTSI